MDNLQLCYRGDPCYPLPLLSRRKLFQYTTKDPRMHPVICSTRTDLSVSSINVLFCCCYVTMSFSVYHVITDNLRVCTALKWQNNFTHACWGLSPRPRAASPQVQSWGLRPRPRRLRRKNVAGGSVPRPPGAPLRLRPKSHSGGSGGAAPQRGSGGGAPSGYC